MEANNFNNDIGPLLGISRGLVSYAPRERGGASPQDPEDAAELRGGAVLLGLPARRSPALRPRAAGPAAQDETLLGRQGARDGITRLCRHMRRLPAARYSQLRVEQLLYRHAPPAVTDEGLQIRLVPVPLEALPPQLPPLPAELPLELLDRVECPLPVPPLIC